MSLETRIQSLITAIGADIKALFGKQDKLISGVNLKTVNGESLLGGGGIVTGTGFTPLIATIAATQASTTTTFVDVTQLSVPLVANATYEIDCFVTFQSAATTTGLGLGFTSPAGSRPMVEVVVPILSTAVASALRTFFPNATTTTSGSVLGTGVSAITSNHTARISGVVVVGGTAGNFQIQFRSEVASSAITLQIGSSLIARRIA